MSAGSIWEARRRRRPAFAALDAAHRARLAHQEDLVHAGGEDLAGDVLGQIARQEDGEGRDLLRPHGLDPLDPLAIRLALGRDGADEAAPGEGRDAIGAHVEARHVEGDGFREADDAELRRGVIGLAEIADQAGGGGEMDEAAALLLPEMLSGGARHIEGAEEMHLHHRLEIIDAHLVEEAVAQDAGIVDDAVDAPEALDGLAHDAFGGGGIGDAGAIGDGLATGGADGIHHLMSGLLILARAIGAAAQIVDHDPGALGGGQQRDLAPDPAARPGDDDDFALQRTVGHRVSLPWQASACGQADSGPNPCQGK